MADNILASGIAHKEHLAVFDRLAEARFAALEVEKVLIYLVDTVDEDALYSLASQFDMLGFKGWKQATTVQRRRDLIKTAIEIHRYKGTVFAIRRAMEAVGYAGVIIEPHTGVMHDGSVDHDGSVSYDEGSNWATFRLIADLGNDLGVNATQLAELIQLVDEYKNVRSHLIDIRYSASLDDSVVPTEEFTMKIIFAGIEESVPEGIDHDGSGSYDGTYKHKTYGDELVVTPL